MAECGIKKYDELPGRVGLNDVDYCRFLLSKCNNPSKISKILDNIPIINIFTFGFSKEEKRKSVLRALEKSYLEHNGICEKCLDGYKR